MRKRKNRVVVYFNDHELEKLNRMVERTVLSREQFIRDMVAGFSIREAPPAPLWETVCFLRRAAAPPAPLIETIRLLRSAAGIMSSMINRTIFREESDRELLLQTVDEIRSCTTAITEQCMPKFKEEKRK